MIDDKAVEILEFCKDHNVYIEVTYLGTSAIYKMSKKTPMGRICKVATQLNTTDLIANNGCTMGYILDNMLSRLNEQIKQTEEYKNDNT